MLANHECEKDFLGYAGTAVKSSSSTKIVLDEQDDDVPLINVFI